MAFTEIVPLLPISILISPVGRFLYELVPLPADLAEPSCEMRLTEERMLLWDDALDIERPDRGPFPEAGLFFFFGGANRSTLMREPAGLRPLPDTEEDKETSEEGGRA